MSTVRLLPLTAPVAAGFIIAGNGIAFLATIAILLLTLLAIREVGRHLGGSPLVTPRGRR